MQTVSPTIWTRVAVFISYDANQYTTNTFTDTHTYIDRYLEYLDEHYNIWK